MLENDTLWGGTYPYGLYMGVPPPPSPLSPGGRIGQTNATCCVQQCCTMLHQVNVLHPFGQGFTSVPIQWNYITVLANLLFYPLLSEKHACVCFCCGRRHIFEPIKTPAFFYYPANQALITRGNWLSFDRARIGASAKKMVEGGGGEGNTLAKSPRPPLPNKYGIKPYLFDERNSQVKPTRSKITTWLELSFVWPPTWLQLDRVGFNLIKIKFSLNSRHVFHPLATAANSRQLVL